MRLSSARTTRHGRDQRDPSFENRRSDNLERVSFLSRLEHFTWAWFTVTMSTGGLAVVLARAPLRFRGLDTIGLVIYVLNLVFFVINCAAITIRFWHYRWTLKASLLHPTESLFVSAMLLSLATIIIGAQDYGKNKEWGWFIAMMRTLFWSYCACALIMTVGLHITIWSTQTHTTDAMTPLWILPIYPMLMVGPMAGAIAPGQPQRQAFDIVFAGMAFQGVGFMISFMVYSAYISRLMTAKLPVASARPGMFVSVGPSGFTVSGLVALGQAAKTAFPADFLDDGDLMARIVELGTLIIGFWLWGLVAWFFLVSLAANLEAVLNRTLHFSLGWWSFVFPNSAFVLATFSIGSALNSDAINVFGTVMTVALVVVWAFVLVMTIRGVYCRQILFADHGEDREEGGFRHDPEVARLRRLQKSRNEASSEF